MLRAMRRVLKPLLVILVGLVLVLVIRTFTQPSHQITPGQAANIAVDVDAAVARLAGAIRLATVSDHDRSKMDAAVFQELHAHLQRSFPRVHGALSRETVNGLTLIYTWPGSDPALEPVVLMAHQDVVPVNPGTETAWEQPPFGGIVADGFLWGRGTLDTKQSLMASLEAVELLLERGFSPKRTVLLVFGHDEEVGGEFGIQAVAKLFEQRGVRPEVVLDEGLVLTEGIVPGVSAPVATIGIAEKGYLTLQLEATGGEGHSSMPPRQTAVGVLARAITRLEESPFPPRWSGPTSHLFEWVGPESAFGLRLVFANLWLFRPIVERVLAGKPSTDATQRTTTAPTMLTGSAQENVLARSARAVVNFRIAPGDTRETVQQRVGEVIADERVTVTVHGGFGSDPSPVSSIDSPAFHALHGAIRKVFPDALATPALVVGATDSRHLVHLARDVYRFVPMRIGPEDTHRVHGTNERIAVANYGEIIQFYAQFVLDVASR